MLLIRFDKDVEKFIVLVDVTRAGNDVMILSRAPKLTWHITVHRTDSAGLPTLVGETSAEMEYFLKSYSNHFKQKLRPFFSVRSEKFARKLPP